MIAINGIPFSEAEKSSVKQEIKEALSIIRKKKVWTLKFHPSVVKKVAQENGGYLEKHPGGALMLTYGRRANEGVEYEVRYYINFRIAGNGEKTFQPKYHSFTGTVSLESSKNADLIYFLTCVSGKCAPYEPIKKYQNEVKFKALYKVDDQSFEIKEKEVVSRLVAKVNTYLYDDEFGLSEKDLRQFALSFGLPGSETDDIIIVVHKLKNYILSRKAGNYNIGRIKQFLSDVKDSTLVDIRIMVEKALKENLFVIVENEGRRAWFDVNEKLEKRSHVVSIPPGRDDKATLIKFFATDKGRKEKLEDYLKSAKKSNPTKVKSSKKEKGIKIEDV